MKKLKNTSPIFFYFTVFLGAFCDNLMRISVILFITYYDANNFFLNKAQLISLASIIFIAPYFLFSGLAGELADKYQKALIIKYLKFFEIMIVIFFLYSLNNQNINLIFLSLLFMGFQSCFFGPIKFSYVKEITIGSKLMRANSYLEIFTFLGIISGIILGTLFTNNEYFIKLLLAFSILGFMISLFLQNSLIENNSLLISKNIFASTFRILKISQSSIFLKSILVISWFWFFSALLINLIPLISTEFFNTLELNILISYLLTFVGIIIGAFYSSIYFSKKRSDSSIFISLFIISIISLGLAFSVGLKIYLLYSVFLLFISSIAVFIIIPMFFKLQEHSHDINRARVIACNNVFNSFFIILSGVFTIIIFSFFEKSNYILYVFSLINLLYLYFLIKLYEK